MPSSQLITLSDFHQKQPQEVFCKKGILRNLATFTGKHLCQSLLLNKVAGFKACNFIKKETLAQVFSCKCCVISKDTFFTEHLRTTATVLCVILLLMVNFWISNVKYNFILVTLQKQSPKRCSTLLKKRLWHRGFPVDFAKSLKASPNSGCFWLYFLKSIESYFFRIVYFTSSCSWCCKTKSLSESLKSSCIIITGRYFSLLVYQRYWLV